MDFSQILDRLKIFFSNKFNAALVVVLVLLVIGMIWGINWWLNRKPTNLPVQEVDMQFDPEGSFALLLPRRDGNALNLNIFRVASYDAISYELAYQASPTEVVNSEAEGAPDKIDRGVQGTLNINDKKSEYSQEILFGTCSQGFTTGGAHCSFDKNVENGTLTLRIQKPYQKGDKVTTVYKMITTWHLQQPDIALGVVASADNHFSYKTTASQQDLATTGYSIVNDLTGAPKLPDGKNFFGKVYALNVPTAKDIAVGVVTIETLDNPPANAKIAYFTDQSNNWNPLDTKIEGNKLTASGKGAGIYAVLTDK